VFCVQRNIYKISLFKLVNACITQDSYFLQVVDEYEVVPVIEYCTSHSIKIWLGILYAYKGLLLVRYSIFPENLK